ncbi:hypothetical protein ACFL6Z_11040 [Pseudomonadota bacterium]
MELLGRTITATAILLLLSIICISGCQTSSKQQGPNNLTIEPLYLQADFTQEAYQTGKVYDFFDVSVRTERASPQSLPATFGRTPKVNTVRMLGGWHNQDVSGDTYKWGGNKFIYDFDQATQRIDTWLNNDWDIFQIVLDNPPWAFQRGYQFVDKPDGVTYLEKDKNGVYGNGLPPADAHAWSQYIHDFITHLINVYGKDTVKQWRFRIGSEIDTRPQHWSDTRQAFFDHYLNTVNAVKAALPSAIVGAHFREASFKSAYVDYTGHIENAYAPHFVKWAKENNVPYDFLAISYYPHIDKSHELDMDAVYSHDLAPIQQHPDWNKNASLEIHEFKLIIKMKKAGFESVKTSHNAAFFAMFSKMLYQHNIQEVFQWGNQQNGQLSSEALTQQALKSMLGADIYKNTVSGTPNVKDNRVDAIFSQHSSSVYDLLLFNFNNRELSYQTPEKVNLSLIVKQPPQTHFQYRIGHINQQTHTEQQFMAQYPKASLSVSQGGWRRDNAHPTMSITSALNDEGIAVFNRHKHELGKQTGLKWTEWQEAKTVSPNTVEYASNNDSSNTVIKHIQSQNSKALIVTDLESFAVQKIEVRF